MERTYLRFDAEETRSHRDVLLWEWLLEEANKLGLNGSGGFVRYHVLHEN